MSGQSTLIDLAKSHVVVYHNILNEFDMAWCVKGFIATRSTLMVTWKIRPRMGIVFWVLDVGFIPPGGCTLCHAHNY